MDGIMGVALLALAAVSGYTGYILGRDGRS